MTTVDDFRQSRVYKLAFKKMLIEKKVPIIYESKTFKMVEEDFPQIILEGWLLSIQANKRHIKI